MLSMLYLANELHFSFFQIKSKQSEHEGMKMDTQEVAPSMEGFYERWVDPVFRGTMGL